MMVIIHEARDVATKSVGENASPFPWLSTGASVNIFVPDAMCSHEVRRFPKYETRAVAIAQRYGYY